MMVVWKRFGRTGKSTTALYTGRYSWMFDLIVRRNTKAGHLDMVWLTELMYHHSDTKPTNADACIQYVVCMFMQTVLPLIKESRPQIACRADVADHAALCGRAGSSMSPSWRRLDLVHYTSR